MSTFLFLAVSMQTVKKVYNLTLVLTPVQSDQYLLYTVLLVYVMYCIYESDEHLKDYYGV